MPESTQILHPEINKQSNIFNQATVTSVIVDVHLVTNQLNH